MVDWNRFWFSQVLTKLVLSHSTATQHQYEKWIQASVDNILNDLGHKIKFENHVRNKSNFFIMQNIFLKNKFF